MSLYDFVSLPVPRIRLAEPLRHPDSQQTIIGHTGPAENREMTVATFPRNRNGETGEKHYFEKYDGYAISQRILFILRERSVERIFIVERNGEHRILEYDPAEFYDGIQIAYSPELNQCIEGGPAFTAADEREFNDLQRVAPVEKSLAEWDRNEVILRQ